MPSIDVFIGQIQDVTGRLDSPPPRVSSKVLADQYSDHWSLIDKPKQRPIELSELHNTRVTLGELCLEHDHGVRANEINIWLRKASSIFVYELQPLGYD
jgi:hypothetical protein